MTAAEIQTLLQKEFPNYQMKVGKRLIVGEVSIYSEDDPEPVAHATCTYSVPPENIQS